MRVTKEQVERLAKAKAEYDRAIDWIAHGEQAERSGHIEPTLTTERLRDMADAAGAPAPHCPRPHVRGLSCL